MASLDLSAAGPAAILDSARQRRAEFCRELARHCWQRRDLLKRTPPLAGIWFFLGATSLVLVALTKSNSAHDMSVMGAIVLASLVSSIAGFAFSAICGAMLFHLGDDPVRVVQIMILCSIANQAAMTWAARHNINWREMATYFAGGAIGLTAGVWILLHVDRTVYARAFGAFLLAYGAFMMLRKPIVVRRPPAAADFLTGVLGGVTGGAAGFPGAFVTIWCGMKGWDKARQRAVFQPFIMIMQIAALLVINLARPGGTGGVSLDLLDLLFVPASLVGTTFGLLLYRRLSDRQFSGVINLFLVVSGLSYVV